MKKRGMSRSMFLAAEIVGAAIVAFLLISNALKWADVETPYKEYLAKDMGLIIGSIFFSPGNIIINYTGNASDYIVDFNENSIAIKIDNDDDGIKKSFSGMKPNQIDLELEYPKKINFAKIGNEILIDKLIKANLDKLTCDEFSGEELTNKKILVDPGYEKENIEPSKEICDIANFFIFKLITTGVNYLNIFSTRKLNEYDGDEGITSINCNDLSKSDKLYDADIIISLRAGKDEDTTKNNIKAFIVSDSEKEKESRKLACLIINSILENNALDEVKITGASIVPIDLEATDKDFPDGIKNRIFVILEIGNTESEQGKLLLEKIPELGDSLSRGFTGYGN